MKHVDDLGEANRVDDTVGVGVMILDDLQHAGTFDDARENSPGFTARRRQDARRSFASWKAVRPR